MEMYLHDDKLQGFTVIVFVLKCLKGFNQQGLIE